MYKEWLYITITSNGQEIATCCILQEDLPEKDLIDFDSFLAYHKYNYSIRNSMFVENVSHVCKDVKEIRVHVIDSTILLTK